VGVAFLAVLAHHLAVVVGVLLEESLRVVVAIDVDLGESVVGGRLYAALVYAGLEPGHDELEPVALLHLLHQLVRVELAPHHQNQVLPEEEGRVKREYEKERGQGRTKTGMLMEARKKRWHQKLHIA